MCLEETNTYVELIFYDSRNALICTVELCLIGYCLKLEKEQMRSDVMDCLR